MGLIWTIETYLRRTGTTPTRFGRDALGDPRFVRDLKNGREPRVATESRVRAFIATHHQEQL